MSTIRVVNLQHTDATEPNIVLQSDGTSVFASGITISGGTNLTVSGTAEFASGTVSAPSITFIDDNNTGIYEPAADTVAITTAATERLRVDSSGNLLVGLTTAVGIGGTPADLNSTEIGRGYINISRDDTQAADHIQFGKNGSVASSIGTSTTNSLTFKTGTTEQMRIDSSGNVFMGGTSDANADFVFAKGSRASFYRSVGIGTASPGELLEIKAASVPAIRLNQANTYYAPIKLAGNDLEIRGSSGNIEFYTGANDGASSTERMRIDSSGFIHHKYTSNNSSTPEGLFINNQNNATGNNASLIFSNDSGNRKKVAISAVDVGSYGASDLVFALDGTDSGSVSLSADEKVRITSSGNVFIGHNNADHSCPLSVGVTAISTPNGNAGSAHTGVVRIHDKGSNNNYYCGIEIRNKNSGDIRILNQDVNTSNKANMLFMVDSGTDVSEAMRIKATGHVNIGTTIDGLYAYADAFTIGDAANCGMTIRSGSTSWGSIYFADGTSGAAQYAGFIDYSHSSDFMRIGAGAAERIRILSGGTILFGTTANDISTSAFGTRISDSNVLSTSRNVAGTSAVAHFYGNAGELRVKGDGDCENTNNSYGSISDVKLKENIVDANSQWNDIKALKVRNYNFKESTGFSTHKQIGLIAQEVESISPGLVSETNDTDSSGNETGTVTKSVSYSILNVKVVKALQEAIAKIETLEAKVAALEAG